MKINFEQFLTSLNVMWQGMLGIFVVVAIIVVCVVVLRKILPMKDNNEEEK